MNAVTVLAMALIAPLSHQSSATPPGIRVQGNQIVDRAGHPVVLRGVCAASMEWTSDGQGHILQSIKEAITRWHADIIRVPLSQDRWFGKAPEQNGDFKPYRALVMNIANECRSLGSYVLLDLHWNDADQWGQNIGQHKMPDQNSEKFWRSFAPVYKNRPEVLFDIYNEPHDVTWDVWQKGGEITERTRGGKQLSYRSPGMQALLNTIRSTGAKNVVVVGGLNWAYEFADQQHMLQDPGGLGIIYSNHAYPFKGESVDAWKQRMLDGAKNRAVIVSEFGSGPNGGAGLTGHQWIHEVLSFITAHRWSWTAWDFHPQAGPTLVSDWNYTPTDFGLQVQKALKLNENSASDQK